jgi:molybdenum cofactor cytidylyltransferase
MSALPRIAAVVLAAGRATRMGSNKLMAEAGGKSLLRHVVDAALASRARPVIVVTGHEANVVTGALQGCDVRFTHNPHFAEGLSTSLKAGIAAVPSEATGAVILLGDMPAVTTAFIDELIEAFAHAPHMAAVAPVHAGQRGNPVLLSRRLFREVPRLRGDRGARPILDDHTDVLEIPGDGSVALDIDTPAALEALRRKP